MLDVITIINQPTYRKSQIKYTGKNVRIGLIDDGINLIYDSIYDIIENSYQISIDSSSERKTVKKGGITHGTLKANIIGNQYMDYEDNVIGIAPGARIIDFDISNDKNEYYFSNILGVFDLIFIEKIKMDVLLIPLTTLYPSDGDDLLSRACNFLVDKGLVVICPAGNFGPESYTIGSPSAAEKVITIGALTKDQKISYYSGRGPTLDGRTKPDFCLPGSSVEIPLSNRVKTQFSGTSVAASIGAAIIALVKEFDPNLSQKQILSIIREVCLDLNYDQNSQGLGTIDIVEVFKGLDLYHEKILPYEVLVKRAISFSFQLIVLFILVFCLAYFLYYRNIL